ncbi:hypothetical protein IFM89_029552 [Coptis chinensis]|uniref:DUF4283 domain-containing protein n=1 Tax=Coptis chinensis TaxID=261450 RepID=A0A835GYJ3_9MAGN|nr:hypothetical protein IFM89_029552 [Coptis chinensis]
MTKDTTGKPKQELEKTEQTNPMTKEITKFQIPAIPPQETTGQPVHGLEQANPGIRETSDGHSYEFTEASHAAYLDSFHRKRSFRLAQLLVPFFKSMTEQVIPEDLLAIHLEIVRAGEAGSDADVSEDMHCDESASGVQEGSNDMSSESNPFLAATYESEDIADDIEVNEQGERINVVIKLVNVPSPINVRLLDENMPLTTTLPACRGENVEGGIASGSPQVELEIHNGFRNKALQSLRLNQWSPKFSGDKQFQSHALVWVRFPGQSLEY